MNSALMFASLLLPVTPMAEPTVEIVAHRGASFDAPENTMASFHLAWKQNADAVELDIFLSKDGKIAVTHDANLKRLTGTDGKLSDKTLDELRQLDFGRWKGEQFKDERMPTLEEVLASIPEGKRLLIEIKSGPEIVPELVRVLKAANRKPAETAIISFSDAVVSAMKQARPDLKAYWIVSLAPKKDQPPPAAEELIAKGTKANADGLDLSATPEVLTPEYARKLKAAGFKLYAWTVNDPDLARKMIALGVESITTDRPEWLREHLKASPPSLRIMSYNIRYAAAKDGENNWDNRKESLLESIQAFSPDLLGTQETLAVQRDYLAEKLTGYEVLGVGRDDGKEAGEMMAVYFRKDRLEKLDGGHFWLSETPEKAGSKSWDSSLPRMVTWLKLRDRKEPKAAPILYLNTHFDHRGPQARLQSATLIRKKLAEMGEGCRLVVTGDFNAGEGSDPYRALFAEAEGKPSPVVDTFRVAYPKKGENEGSASGFKADATRGPRIDWIGCSRDWEVLLANIDRTAKDGRTPSDHFAVTAVLTPSRPRTVRVLCYNVHHGEGVDGKLDLPRVAKVIADAKADLVAVQEVDRLTTRTGKVDQAAELARRTGLQGKFGKAIDFAGGEYGQVILSRFPLGEVTVHELPGKPDRERRVAVEARVTVGGRELSFVSTHLDHADAESRERQAEKLNELFGKAIHPVVLAGDLNATSDSKPLSILGERWSIASGIAPTYPAEKPAKQIDYVLFRPTEGVRVVECKVLDEAVASDHRPVLVVLELR